MFWDKSYPHVTAEKAVNMYKTISHSLSSRGIFIDIFCLHI